MAKGCVRLCCFVAAFITPPIVAFLCLTSAMPVRQACLGTLGSLVVAGQRDLVNLPFFKTGLGTDRPAENLWAMLSMTGLYALVLVPAGLIGLSMRWRGRGRLAILRGGIAVAVFAVVAGALWWCRDTIEWDGFARPLPLLILLTIVATVAGFLFHRREEAAQRRLIRQMSLLVLAVLLLSKMLLYARIFHYGFILAMPATLLLCIAALDWLPAFIARRGGYGGVLATAATALMTVAVVFHLRAEAQFIGQKTERVGVGADAFWADPRGAFVNAAVARIAAHSSPKTTLAVLPEGVMINCLTGLRNPTPYINLMPIEMLFFGEQRVVDSFQAHPPDLIALAHKDTSEFGFRYLGADYGRQLGAWIRAHYRPLAGGLIGSPPLRDDKFGILLLENDKRAQGGSHQIAPR